MHLGLRLFLMTMAAVLLMYLIANAQANESDLVITKQSLCSQAATEQVVRRLGTVESGAAEEMYADEFRACMERMKNIPVVFS